MRIRTALAALAFLVAPALAADMPDAAGRFSLGPSRDGFVRLDTRTGAVSHCASTGGIWRCEPLAAEDVALKARLDALSAEVAKLTATVAALDARVSRIVPPEPAVAAPAEEMGPGPAERILARFLDMVRRLKHHGDEA